MKRVFDILAASVGLVVFSPLMLYLILRIRRDMGAPVFFRQTRPGKDGKPFEMIKFRSMRDATAQDGTPLSDAERLTPLGQKLRSSSLDELPELWNVIRGDMSLVGPRPLLMEYLPLYSAEQARRHEVRPGVTGWAQVNGLRGDTSLRKRLQYDIFYVRHWSLLFDLRILIMTLGKGFVHRNAH